MKKHYAFLIIIFFFSKITLAQNWEAVGVNILPKTFEVKSISVVSSEVVWAVADSVFTNLVINESIPIDNRPVVLRTTDGGATWDYRVVSEAIGRFGWDIHGIDAKTAIFTSNQFIPTDDRPIFKTIDGGLTWKKIVPPNLSGGFLLHFFDAKNGLAMNGNYFSTTADAGETWEAVPEANTPPLLSGESVNTFTAGNFSAQVGDRVWFGTSKGRVWRTLDRGQHWDATKVTGLSQVITSVAFTDSLRGVAVVPGTLGVIYPVAKLFGTSDGGKTWSPLPAAPMKQVASVAAVPGATGQYLVGSLWLLDNLPTPVVAFNKNNFAASAWVNQLDSFFLDCAHFISPTVGYAASLSYKAIDKDTLPDGHIISTNLFYKWKGNLVGLEENHAVPSLRVACSPNPAIDFLRLDFDEIANGQPTFVEVTDAIGRVVFSKPIFEKTIDVSALLEGIYFLNIRSRERIGVTTFLKK